MASGANPAPDRRRGDRRSDPRTVSVRPTEAHVDAGALRHNLQQVQDHIGSGSRVLGVVKADGYGHGAVDTARTLVDAGAWGLAVSLVEEGVELREASVHAPVVVLGGVYPGSEDVVVHRQLTPVVWNTEHLARLSAAVVRAGARALPVHVNVDTGMSRLGVLPDQIGPVLDWLRADAGRTLRLEGMMTHLACADDPDDDFTSVRQLGQFKACLEATWARRLEPSLRHVCNSAGMVRFREAHYDMVRPGIALYGAASDARVQLPGLRMAMSLSSRILGIRALPAGTRVSYGGKHRLEQDAKLAIVPVGYGDGYIRGMSGRASVLVRGHSCPVVGNITMDVCMVDVTHLPDVREGERVTLLGCQGSARIDAHDWARWGDVLPYEVVCGLSKRVPRRLED